MGYGKLTGWIGQIFPFADAPRVPVEVMWYAVPPDNPTGPTTVFTDRFWDARERWFPPGVGTNPYRIRPYFGALPTPDVGDLVGTPEQYLTGLSYATYLAGGYANPNGCAVKTLRALWPAVHDPIDGVNV